MKLPSWAIAALLLASVSRVGAIERLPIETFSKTPEMSQALLSPDGMQLAYLADHNGVVKLHILDFGGKPPVRLNLGTEAVSPDSTRSGLRKEVSTYVWSGNRRLVLTTTTNGGLYGVLAMNSDGKQVVGISGWENPNNRKTDIIGNVRTISVDSWTNEVIYAFPEGESAVLMLDRHDSGGGSYNRPDIVRVNTLTGTAKTVVKNPGEVARWGVDFGGVARVGILSHGDLSGVLYRDSEKADWRTALPLKDRRGSLRTLGFDASSKRILVAGLTEDRRWAPFALDPASGELGDPLLVDAGYDIIPERYIPGIANVALVGPIFSRAKQSMVGFRYYTEAARTKWFDPEYAAYQKAVDKYLPNTVNLLINQSDDGKKQLWFSFSDQNPGTYTVLDVAKRSFVPIAPRMPWIKPAQMASTLSIKYAARDGLEIHGYLTVPAGHQPKDLPLVVMPHGGPWVRDVWGYDPLVQLLANRGYAVLQMNYRGSTGYGDELLRNARREIGGKIQDDIEDATRWAIASGIAKADRIAIMGMSYGGYSTLFALGRTPDLYRCGISAAGVTDWPALYEDSDVAENKSARNYWREQIGDPGREQDLAKLRAASPVNFADKITAPVLIVQGKDDQRVPQDQAKRMIAALEKAGRKPESLILANVGHNYGDEKKRLEIYTAMVGFLEKNLGPGVE